MAPNISAPTGVLHETDEEISFQHQEVKNNKDGYKLRLVWRNIILFAYLHAASIYGFYLMFTSAKLLTSGWGKFRLFELQFNRRIERNFPNLKLMIMTKIT